jgi:hypothetical protein
MESNDHYQKAVTSEPAMVRGSDQHIREILNRTTEATLAVALENRLSNLISLMSIPEFIEDRDIIEAEIRKIMKLKTAGDAGPNESDSKTPNYLPVEEDEPKLPDSAYGVFELKKPFI